MTRTRTTSAQAKKTATTRKTTAKKAAPAPRKPAAKKALPKTSPVNKATVVDLRRPLPVRRKVFVGPMGVQEQAAIRAALAAARAALPVPVSAWHGPVARLDHGTTLTHTPAHATTDQTPTFGVAIRCPHGAVHAYTIHTAQELQRARHLTAQCQQRTRPTAQWSAPNPVVRVLGDQLTHTSSANAETQPMPALNPADDNTPKEHPEP